MANLDGQIALVTGASRGIGQAIALNLGKAGATVIGTATSDAGAEAISQYLADNDIQGHGHAFRADVAESMAGLLAHLKGTMPTILVNNAAITRDNLMMRMKDDEWDSVIETNLSAVFRLTKACLRPMMKARTGRIINISSVVGFSGNAGQSNYVAAKAGLVGLTKSLAREVGSRGISVNSIAPGFIASDMTDALPEAQKKAMIAQIPLGRAGQATEIAATVEFLTSSAAAYITGETIHVNGGMYMG
jgi:3-oxoacyl-[acyl-carrier protein] reductase